MKTKLTLIAGMALAVALGAWSASAAERGSARGGAGDLFQRPAPVLAPVESTVMACANCKSDWLVRTDFVARGANKPTITVEKHLCQMCGTVLTTVSQGKQAKNVARHTCAGCDKT